MDTRQVYAQSVDAAATAALSPQAWKTYAYWATWVGVAFFAVYPTCNWIADHRTHTFALYAPAELRIPFVPAFIWAYLSMYALFILPPFFLDAQRLTLLGRRLVYATLCSGAVFLLLPSHLGFPRALPDDPMLAGIYANIFFVDLPHNMAPSLHVVFSTAIIFALTEAARSGAARVSWWLWWVLISLSTVFVHQHHLIDIAAGFALVYFFQQWITPRRSTS
jgi:membrane-associated phospholipid phosphatase